MNSMIALDENNVGIVACSMLKNEILKVMETQDLCYPVIWLEKGLHEFPKKLKKALEEKILELSDKKYILLLYGMCGYAVVGLKSDTSSIIVPKFDDCVRMLMCTEKGLPIPTKADRFYFTKEWITDKFILNEFDEYCRTYGEEKGRMIAEMMIEHYSGIDFIETGTYDVSACIDEIKERAAGYGLNCGCVRGTVRVLEKMLTGDWDEEFVVNMPGRKIEMSDFDDRPRCG